MSKTNQLIIVVFVLTMFGCSATKDTEQSSLPQWKGKYKIVDTSKLAKIPPYITFYDTSYIINNGEITDTLIMMRKIYINLLEGKK